MMAEIMGKAVPVSSSRVRNVCRKSCQRQTTAGISFSSSSVRRVAASQATLSRPAARI
jgi:hypothetical protein